MRGRVVTQKPHSNHNSGQWFAGILLASMTFGLGMETAEAQPRSEPYNPYIRRVDFPGSEERNKDVDALLKSLVEREFDRRNGVDLKSNPRLPAAVLPDLSIRSDELVEIRRTLANFSRESDRLATSLNNDARLVPGVRQVMTDVLKIRARSSLVAERAQSVQDIRTLIPEIQTLDKSWRMISFQMSQLRGLSRDSVDSIKRMNVDIKTLDKVLHIDPQLDYNELLRLTAGLSTSIRNLIEDVEVELGRSGDSRALVIMGGRVEQQARYLSRYIADQQNYQVIVAEYQQFDTMMDEFIGKLWSLENRYIERGIRRVQDIDSSLREQLWLPTKHNKRELLQATSVLKRDVDQFFLRAPLKLLIELPRGTEVIPIADQFYGVCIHFEDVVTRGEEFQELADAFSYIEDAWKEFHAVFVPMKSQGAQNVLSQIEQSINTLRDRLGVQVSFDARKATELAAALSTLSTHLDQDIRAWLTTSREPYRAAALRDSQEFVAMCNKLHRDLLSTSDRNQLQKSCGDIVQSWQRVRGYVDRCNTNERYHLQRISESISPNLVDLWTMLK